MGVKVLKVLGAVVVLLMLVLVVFHPAEPAAGQSEEPAPTPTPTPRPDPGEEQSDPRLQHEPHDAFDGLAGYGPVGPITRDRLDPGVAIAVSNEALELAQSGELAAARASWQGAPVDFVGQVDYQLEFRNQNDYMDQGASHIGRVLEMRADNLGIQGLGLYLTQAEADEFQRRIELGDRIPAVVSLIAGVNPDNFAEGREPRFDSNFGGVWQDQFDGGAIVVAVGDASRLDEAAIAEVLGGRENLRVLSGHPSWDEVNRWRDELLRLTAGLGIDASVAIDSTTTGRRITVSVPVPAELEKADFGDVPREWVTIVEGGADSTAGNPSSTHGASSQMAGLQIEFDPDVVSYCTWGINGNNGIDHYLMTAGHCGSTTFQNFNGWSSVLEVHQNNSFHLTPGWRYVISGFGHNNDSKGVSTGYADDNCYHWGHCQKHIANRAWHNSWEINSDVTCASLSNSNVFRCGYILEENYTSTGTCASGSEWVRTSMDVIDGDSGAGAIDQGPTATTFDAILVCKRGSGFESVFMTAYKFKVRSGLDANCHPTVISYYSPSSWGTCPGINR